MNCSYFGGNPDNITLFGESAGGASTHYMMLTERTKDLFHRAILMSGTSLCPWALNKCQNRSYRLAKAMGYEGENNDKLIFEYLNNAKGSQLLKGVKHIFTSEEKKKLILFPFGPVIEPYESSHCVIPEDPRLMMRKAWSNQIPIIIGGTSDEGLMFNPDNVVNDGPYWWKHEEIEEIINNFENCEHLVPMDLNLHVNDQQCIEYGLKLKKIYFYDEKPNKIKHCYEYMDLMKYKMFWHPVHRTIISRFNYGNSKTYVYRFSPNSKLLNLFHRLFCENLIENGACHGDDCSYIFYSFITPIIKSKSDEYHLINNLINIFYNFSKYGHINLNINDNELNWNYVENFKVNQSENNDEKINYKCLNIDLKEMKLIDLPEMDKLKIWDDFYEKSNNLI